MISTVFKKIKSSFSGIESSQKNRPAGPVVGLFVLLTFSLLASGSAVAQIRDPYPTVVVPQARTFGMPRPQGVSVTGVNARIDIRDQAATTSIEFQLTNNGPMRQETRVVFPVQSHVVIKGMSFSGLPGEGVAEIMEKDAARRIYDDIVRRMRDPALLEFIGYNLIQTSVFPVEPYKTETVTLVYEELLTSSDNRIDYTLLRSESIDYRVPWTITASIRTSRTLSTIYSPSHELVLQRHSPNFVDVAIDPSSKNNPGAFRLAWLADSGNMNASFYAYPDSKTGGGMFLMLAGLPPKKPVDRSGSPEKREVTLVLDRSGSMNGEKLAQVREAALQVLAGLEFGESFNIIVYNETIDAFADSPVVKTQQTANEAGAYINGILARGGTNIHDALFEALRQPPSTGMLPIVLFLTDGLPTVGETSEKAIRSLVTAANPHHRRVFTFGVGVDVNAPLLDRIAQDSRAVSTYVLPGEDVEVKVSQVFKRLAGPILTNPDIRVSDSGGLFSVIGISGEPGPPSRRVVTDLIPDKLPDLFEGDQLVLLGRYTRAQPLTFRLSGNYLGRSETFDFSFDPATATTRNGFVPRLWASRKIAVLTDAIRQLGGDEAYMQPGRPTPNDPRVRELVEEIVRLSTEYGILTEYTAFLAKETEPMPAPEIVYRMAEKKYRDMAMNERSGAGAVSQSVNALNRMKQKSLNYRNEYTDADMNTVTIDSVQQVNDMAFYQRNGVWTDSRITMKAQDLTKAIVVEWGTEAYRRLLDSLIRSNRQGALALHGEISIEVDGQLYLVRNP